MDQMNLDKIVIQTDMQKVIITNHLHLNEIILIHKDSKIMIKIFVNLKHQFQ